MELSLKTILRGGWGKQRGPQGSQIEQIVVLLCATGKTRRETEL